jgi:hypothetical protein
MIDNAGKTERLFASMQAALPIPARVTPELAAAVKAQNPASEIPSGCFGTWISYAGDEGGIVCRLGFGRETEKAVFASITHLVSTHGCHWLAISPISRSTESNACGADPPKHEIKHLV